MPALNALELERDIEKNSVRPVYALVGEDDALVSNSIATLKRAIERPDLPGSIVRTIESGADPRAVFDELRTQPFMGMKGMRMVIVQEGADFIADNAQALEGYLARPSPFGVLVLRCDRPAKQKAGNSASNGAGEGKKAGKPRNILKLVEKTGAIVDCSKMDWRAAREVIRAEMRARGKDLTPQAAQLLLDTVGPNLAALRQEIEKLVLFSDGRAKVSEEDVEEVVPESRARSIFELSDAIAKGDTSEALRLGEEMMLRGESPESMVAFLGAQMRRLWQVKRLTAQRASPKAISETLGMPDFAVKRAVQAVKDRSQRWFAARISMLARADTELKTIAMPAREKPVWMAAFLARMCGQ
jgi:DNA polymerase-3 subunit delta